LITEPTAGLRDLQKKRQNQKRMEADYFGYVAPRKRAGIVQEYAPFVFGGVMLVAAFAFAGNYMGQNAIAHNISPDEQTVTILAPVTNIISKGSLLPEGENFDIVNLNALNKQMVLGDGKGDFVNPDPIPDVAVAPSKKIVITPASVDLTGKNKNIRDVQSPIKRLALAPKPSAIEKSFKLKRSEKQVVVAQRRVRLAEENCLARAVYFEARSESKLGQLAVAKVILNRTKDPAYPKSICGVVYQGSGNRNSCQFSFACDGLADDVRQPAAWANAKQIAQRAIAGSSSMTAMSTATNYHADYVRPKWAKSMKRLIKIGHHIFYSDS
jgi:spore germination cell wall hydrolase CwlJ-like protein